MKCANVDSNFVYRHLHHHALNAWVHTIVIYVSFIDGLLEKPKFKKKIQIKKLVYKTELNQIELQ